LAGNFPTRKSSQCSQSTGKARERAELLEISEPEWHAVAINVRCHRLSLDPKPMQNARADTGSPISNGIFALRICDSVYGVIAEGG